MDIQQLLQALHEHRGSDLFISVNAPPIIKVHGQLKKISDKKCDSQMVEMAAHSLMNESQQVEFQAHKEANFAYFNPSVGRFRVSAYYQQGEVGLVIRRIEAQIPTLDELQLPGIVKSLSMAKRGLIIVVGATGVGKSTSLAAMLGYRNQTSSGHIISIEDPIEFIHHHQNCLFSQREVGLDTESYEVALKNAMRQAPDVINIGEIRSADTMQHAITFAETGHLCLATLHANNANQALDRIIHFFPQEMHKQVWLDLSFNLKAIIAQQLIPSIDGKKRHAAMEILVNSPMVENLVRKGEIHALKEYMGRKNQYGMQTFDQHLFRLYKEKKISPQEAIRHADSENNLRLMMKLAHEQQDPSQGPHQGDDWQMLDIDAY